MTANQYKVIGSDESYTYPYLITPIVKFIEEFRINKNIDKLTVWCPFDLEKDLLFNNIQMFASNYVKIFKEQGCKVIASHIATGKDFFEYEPEKHYDVIISNPPFRNKKLFFERALKLNKPFCLLNTASWLNDSGVYNVFKNNNLQLLMTNKRAKFFTANGCIDKGISFKSIYYCKDFLINRDIEWFELPKDKGT
jgi:hypothetical protein